MHCILIVPAGKAQSRWLIKSTYTHAHVPGRHPLMANCIMRGIAIVLFNIRMLYIILLSLATTCYCSSWYVCGITDGLAYGYFSEPSKTALVVIWGRIMIYSVILVFGWSPVHGFLEDLWESSHWQLILVSKTQQTIMNECSSNDVRVA